MSYQIEQQIMYLPVYQYGNRYFLDGYAYRVCYGAVPGDALDMFHEVSSEQIDGILERYERDREKIRHAKGEKCEQYRSETISNSVVISCLALNSALRFLYSYIFSSKLFLSLCNCKSFASSGESVCL